MSLFTQFLDLLFGRKKVDYPNEFALIDYTPIARENGIEDDQNKVIIKYGVDRFGNREIRKLRYSRERVNALEEVHKIPIFDKTEKEIRFPIFSRILPSEIVYHTRR